MNEAYFSGYAFSTSLYCKTDIQAARLDFFPQKILWYEGTTWRRRPTRCKADHLLLTLCRIMGAGTGSSWHWASSRVQPWLSAVHNITCMCWDCGRKLEHLEKTHTNTWRTCKQTEQARGFKPKTFFWQGETAKNCITMPPIYQSVAEYLSC